MKKLVLIILLSVVVNAKFINTARDRAIVQERIDHLNSSVEELKGLSTLEQLKKINTIFNSFIKYSDDMTVYGKRDYKAVIQETVATGRGDCDDYTLAY